MEIETYQRNGLTVTIQYDDQPDNPATWGNYTIVDREYLGDYVDDDGNLTEDISDKLRDGRAFWIDKYEHSGVSYSLNNEGMQCRFDTSTKWGLIVFTDEYATNFDDYAGRQEMARQDLETYTEWANGEVYGYTIEDADGNEIEDGSLWGMYGLDYCRDEANAIADAWTPPRSLTAKPAGAYHL